MVATVAIFMPLLATSARAQSQPTDADCMNCHDGYDKSLVGSAHRLGSTVTKPAVAVACISCHTGWDKHLDDPKIGNIANPSRLFGKDAVEACTACHTPHRNLDNYGGDVHTNLQTNCSSCHKVHNNSGSLLIDGDAKFCWNCHQATQTKFSRRSAHPVKQGDVTCLSCHRFTRRTDQNAAYGFDNTCRNCHSDKGGPYLHEHPVANAYMPDGNGCVECHEPHGSENDQLLKQPKALLCNHCHAVPTHNTAHGGVYAGMDCLTCHADIHGSSTSGKLLSSDISTMFGQSCWCHGVN